MHSSDLPLDQPRHAPHHEAVVQDRPTLGNLPRTRRGHRWWLSPLIDLLVSCVALTSVALAVSSTPFPALPIAPLLLIAAYGALGVYGSSLSNGDAGLAWPVARLLGGAFFAWSASLLIPLDGGSQLALWALFALLDFGARAIAAPYLQRADPVERWVLVGDEATAARLEAYQPLRSYATIVCTVTAGDDGSQIATRIAALEVVDRNSADRVVIESRHADDERLLELVGAFKSIGVPVSLLPRPLDLLESPATTAGQVAGVPLINVGALAVRGRAPYTGPDRRRNRKTRVSVVIPAMNEGKNITSVLSRLPDDLHEVILVDGNSRDDTVAAACQAYPRIIVLTQSGRGKGDALRTGFAAVTGNLVVMLDADGSADPAEIPRFIEALEAGADFAKGSRFLPGGGSADITQVRRLGNAALSGTANLLHDTHFTDLCYGYNAFWARCLPFISIDAPGFEVETLINLRVAGAGMKITEVPSYEANRISGQSNLKTFRDGFRVLGTILDEGRRRRTLQPERRHTDDGAARKSETATTA